MRVHLKTLGCRLNEAEQETWSRDFHKRGHQLTNQIDNAELVIINTCAVTEEAVKKSRKLLRRAQRDNPHAKLVVSGCYASLSPNDTLAIPGVDLVIPNSEKSQLVELILQKLDLNTEPESAIDPNANQLLFSGRQRAFIKVQDGCRYRCTFCIVTLARGAESSRPVNEIIDEINLLAAQDIKEVVLTGVHLGGYGSDINSDLVTLVEQVLAKTPIPRIRMGSLEPWELHDGFWQLFENPRVMPHLHLPLQSGADSVLRRMARRCKTAEFSQLVEKARMVKQNFNITTDIIVGFPGETDQEWQQSLAYVESIGFGHVHIFAFSPREGTKAAILTNPVSRDSKRERSQQLHILAETMKKNHLERLPGLTVDVLFEGNQQTQPDGSVNWSGYTPNFNRVTVNTMQQDLCNRIESVKIETTGDNGILKGTIVSAQ